MIRDALVVGINQYPFLKDTPASLAKHLTTPAADAEAIAQMLESYAGNEIWSVQRLPETDKYTKPCIDNQGIVKQEVLEKAISELLNPNTQCLPEVALLFFSGHGFRREQDGKTEGFLATSDVRLNKNQWGISLDWLRQKILNSPIKKQIVWLDCCHSGELLNFLNEAELDNWLKGGDRLLIVACRDDKVAYGLSEYGVLTKVLLDAVNPENSPQEESISSYTIKRFIDKQLSSNTLLRSQFPLVKHFGEEIIFWHGSKALNSGVELIDASLDPHDSPYQEIVEGEVKKIGRQKKLEIVDVTPVKKKHFRYDFPTIDFKFQNTGNMTACLSKFTICVLHAEVDSTPVLDFYVNCSRKNELVILVTNNGWGRADNCQIQINEPILNRLFSESIRQRTIGTIESGEWQEVLKLKLDMANSSELKILSQDFVNIKKFGIFSLDDFQPNKGLKLSLINVRWECKDEKGNKMDKKNTIDDIYNESNRNIVITERGFIQEFYLPPCSCVLLSDITYIVILDPQQSFQQKNYPISRKILSGDVERFHIMIGSQMSCNLRLKFKFYNGKKEVVESEEFNIDIWKPINSNSNFYLMDYEDGDFLNREVVASLRETTDPWRERKIEAHLPRYPFVNELAWDINNISASITETNNITPKKVKRTESWNTIKIILYTNGKIRLIRGD